MSEVKSKIREVDKLEADVAALIRRNNKVLEKAGDALRKSQDVTGRNVVTTGTPANSKTTTKSKINTADMQKIGKVVVGGIVVYALFEVLTQSSK